MKTAELRRKGTDELHEMLAKHRSELMDARFQHATGALDNPRRLAAGRRDISRVLTIIGERGRDATTTEATA